MGPSSRASSSRRARRPLGAGCVRWKRLFHFADGGGARPNDAPRGAKAHQRAAPGARSTRRACRTRTKEATRSDVPLRGVCACRAVRCGANVSERGHLVTSRRFEKAGVVSGFPRSRENGCSAHLEFTSMRLQSETLPKRIAQRRNGHLCALPARSIPGSQIGSSETRGVRALETNGGGRGGYVRPDARCAPKHKSQESQL